MSMTVGHPDRVAVAASLADMRSPPEQTTLALLRQLARAWLGLLADCAREAGMHQTDYLALIRIVASEGMVPAELRQVLGLSAGSMTDLADRLERRGLVKRVDRPEDRRSIELKPTAKGKRTAERTMGRVLRSVAQTVGGLEADELAVVRRFLAEIALVVSDAPIKPGPVR
jgi:DNA-binding MarR family transcriptional regulator